jgi:hypothetical protein
MVIFQGFANQLLKLVASVQALTPPALVRLPQKTSNARIAPKIIVQDPGSARRIQKLLLNTSIISQHDSQQQEPVYHN